MENNKHLQGDQISDDTVQELMEKYDPEAGFRKLKGVLYWVTLIGLVAFSLFQLYTAIFGVLPAQLQRTIHLGFALTLIFLLFPASKRKEKKSNGFK
ncbi:hypothetical protein [Bacillus sp. PK3_68]|uniref:hypothetical protein n=1 Tax=Bacillus sp. PK3_68 TaxID=2027408 RepID=UPI00217E6409|nr:hypothetical protein [Bacillus sp. PK3_68]